MPEGLNAEQAEERRLAFEVAVCGVIDYYNNVTANLRREIVTLRGEKEKLADRCKALVSELQAQSAAHRVSQTEGK